MTKSSFLIFRNWKKYQGGENLESSSSSLTSELDIIAEPRTAGQNEDFCTSSRRMAAGTLQEW